MDWNKVILKMQNEAKRNLEEARKASKSGDTGLMVHHNKRAIFIREAAGFLLAGLE